jgi:FKBP-type peptidyl-prolyl cis-trans isomerase
MREQARGPTAALALVGALALSSCGGGGGDGRGSVPLDALDAAIVPPVSEPVVEVPDGPPPDELVVEDLVVGDGAEAVEGSLVDVDFVGVVYDSGKTFSSSYDAATPLRFLLGVGDAMVAWDQGLSGMREGGRRRLIIPPELGFVDQPTEEVPAGSTLVFVVDLLRVLTTVDLESDEPEVEPLAGGVPAELQVEDLVVGEGTALAAGNEAVFHSIAAFGSTGRVFDSTWARHSPVRFDLGADNYFPGWKQGVIGMQPGGRRRIVVPPELGVAADGAGQLPPDEALVFVVELLAIVRP